MASATFGPAQPHLLDIDMSDCLGPGVCLNSSRNNKN
jgi:hypothetical protein